MHEFDRLVKKMEEFKPYLDNKGLMYTYVAPKDNEKFFRFLASIYHSSASHSLFMRLSNPEVVRKLLDDLNFLEDTELEIYIATNDQYAVQWMNKTLKEYIKEKELDFHLDH
jgi:hypothetical protein